MNIDGAGIVKGGGDSRRAATRLGVYTFVVETAAAAVIVGDLVIKKYSSKSRRYSPSGI